MDLDVCRRFWALPGCGDILTMLPPHLLDNPGVLSCDIDQLVEAVMSSSVPVDAAASYEQFPFRRPGPACRTWAPGS